MTHDTYEDRHSNEDLGACMDGLVNTRLLPSFVPCQGLTSMTRRAMTPPRISILASKHRSPVKWSRPSWKEVNDRAGQGK